MNLSIIHSPEDEKYKIALSKHLSILQRIGEIDDIYFKSLIQVGETVQNYHLKKIKESDIICVLVSSDFLSTDYCYNVELKTIIDLHLKQELLCIPIICRECYWDVSPLGGLLPAPKYGQPIESTSWESTDSPYTLILERIKESILLIKKTNSSANPNNKNIKLDFSSYITSIERQYGVWRSRYVNLDTNEKIFEVPLYAEESFWNENDDSENVIRKGLIVELKETIEENNFVIIGDAGSGKSTTLQYMLLSDCQAAKNNNNKGTIPVYIELKLYSEFRPIVDLVKDKLKIKTDVITQLIQTGRIAIYFDGFNETDQNFRSQFVADYKSFIQKYPLCGTILTSRPNAYKHNFLNIPVFQLKRLNDSQIRDFIDKNSSSAQSKKMVLKEVFNNSRIKEVVRIPLMLFMLISVVHKSKGNLPSNKVKLIQTFINNLYNRESTYKDTNFDPDTVHILLCWLGFESRNQYGSNIGMTVYDVINILKIRKYELGINIDLLYLIRKGIELNILAKDNDKYSFTHEMYQEYYSAEEMFNNSLL